MINGKTYLTINTDAGVIEGKAGGYAIWIRGDDLTVKKSGKFKEVPENALVAEMKAILNGLHEAMKTRDFFKVDIIVINTDCQAGINMFTRGIGQVKPLYLPLREEFDRIVKQIKPKIKLKHVKGHSTGETKKGFINNWCDTEARKHYSSKYGKR